MINSLKKIVIILFLITGLTLLYTSSLIGVNDKSKSYLKTLKKELLKQGYKPNLFVISGRRWHFDNLLLNKFGGASSKSRHLKGEAIGLGLMLELPMVIVNVQRGGPSTGLPTKTEQSDLLQAMYGRNGDSPLPVIATKSPSDCFDA